MLSQGALMLQLYVHGHANPVCYDCIPSSMPTPSNVRTSHCSTHAVSTRLLSLSSEVLSISNTVSEFVCFDLYQSICGLSRILES